MTLIRSKQAAVEEIKILLESLRCLGVPDFFCSEWNSRARHIKHVNEWAADRGIETPLKGWGALSLEELLEYRTDLQLRLLTEYHDFYYDSLLYEYTWFLCSKPRLRVFRSKNYLRKKFIKPMSLRLGTIPKES